MKKIITLIVIILTISLLASMAIVSLGLLASEEDKDVNDSIRGTLDFPEFVFITRITIVKNLTDTIINADKDKDKDKDTTSGDGNGTIDIMCH